MLRRPMGLRVLGALLVALTAPYRDLDINVLIINLHCVLSKRALALNISICVIVPLHANISLCWTTYSPN